jgi:hypothetical protein
MAKTQPYRHSDTTILDHPFLSASAWPFSAELLGRMFL